MLKKYIIFIFALSCVSVLSCKSASIQNNSNLASIKITPPSEIDKYVTKVRVVAETENETCTDPQKKLVSLGNATEINNASYRNPDNYIDKQSNTSDTISLYEECLPYKVTLAYHCGTHTINGTTYNGGFCFMGSESTKGHDTVENADGSKSIKLAITLYGQDGGWKNFKKKVVAKTEEPLTLANMFNSMCLWGGSEESDLDYAYLDSKYLHSSKKDKTDSTKHRRFYYVKDSCLFNSGKDSPKSLLIKDQQTNFSAEMSKKQLSNSHFTFQDDEALASVKNETSNSAKRYVLANVTLDGANEYTTFSNENPLIKFQKTSVENRVVIQILKLPDTHDATKLDHLIVTFKKNDNTDD